MRLFATAILFAALSCPASLSLADEKPASSGRMVAIEVVIAQFAEGVKDANLSLESGDKLATRIQELEKQGHAGQVMRVRLTTLDQNQAQLQFGQRTPVATGRMRTAAGFGRGGNNPAAGGVGPAISTSYTMENVGAMIGVSPRVEDDGSVTLKLDIEKSHLEPPPATEAGADAADAPPARTATLQSRSMVRLRPGQTTVVGQSQSTAKGESGQTVILVSAQVSDAPATAKPAGVAEERLLKVFALQNLPAEASAELLKGLFKDDVKFAADARTNSLLAQGTPTALAEIEAILARLDQQKK